MSPTPVFEIVTFRALPGVPAERVRAVAAAVDPTIRGFPGLQSRELLHDEESGEWMEACRWASLAHALAAAEAAMKDPVLVPYFALMDMESIVMRHWPIVPLGKAVPA